MNRHLKSWVIAIILCLPFISSAEITLPSIFGDGMVLQQQSDAAIWGMAKKGSSVELITSWDKKTYTTDANSEGKWKLKVSTPAAGGPYSITISDGTSLTLSDVLIGEVWVCSGQSNMQMIMRGYRNEPITGSNEAIATSRNPSIRLFTTERDKNLTRKDDFTGTWKHCEPGNVAEFSATAYFFGRMINEALDVPVGLICSAWGGTRIEPWISEEGLKDLDFVQLPKKSSKKDFSQQTPTVLFNAMIAPMVGYSIRGGLWYQGESNRNEPKEYTVLMQRLIENWRDEWGVGEFPFYFCQIAPFDYGKGGLNSAFLREAQFKAAQSTPNAGMACLMDVGEKSSIHPANKKAAGERLAFQALANTYKKEGICYSGPVLKDMNIDGNVIHLTFDHAPYGLTSYGKKLENFYIAGKNKRFVKAEAVITRKGVTLMSRIEEPVAVRYAFEDFVVGDLFNTDGLPASSFRTDDWELE